MIKVPGVTSTVSVIPNHSDAYLLRIVEDGYSYAMPLITWHIEWCVDNTTGRDWHVMWPLGSSELCSNEMECIVFRGVWTVPEDCSFTTESEAVDYCVASLRKLAAR